MNTRRGQFLSVAAIMSVVAAGFLALGYISSMEIGARHVSGYTTPAINESRLWLGHGSIGIGYVSMTKVDVIGKPPRQGYSLLYESKFEVRHLKSSFWEFPATATDNPGVKIYCLQVPAWFALLPCLFAPLRWMRKRRRNVSESGFSVVLSEP